MEIKIKLNAKVFNWLAIIITLLSIITLASLSWAENAKWAVGEGIMSDSAEKVANAVAIVFATFGLLSIFMSTIACIVEHESAKRLLIWLMILPLVLVIAHSAIILSTDENIYLSSIATAEKLRLTSYIFTGVMALASSYSLGGY